MSYPRNRSSGPVEKHGEYSFTRNGGVQPGYPKSHLLSSETRAMSDYVTPGYRRIVRSGGIVNTPCSMVVTSHTCGGGTYSAKNTYSGVTYALTGNYSTTKHGLSQAATGGHWGSVAQANLDLEPLVAKAKLQALAQVDSTPYAFAEDVAELRETLLFLRNPVRDLVRHSRAFKKYVNALRKKKKYRGFDPASAFSDAWLQYRFAISPLVRSITSLLDARQTTTTRHKRRVARGFARGKDQEESQYGYNRYSTALTFATRASHSAEIKAGIIYEVANPVDDWRFKYGLRYKDIPVTLWAIAPYSFMVDRVVQVSDSIRGLTNLLDPYVEIKAGFVVTKEDLSSQVRWTGDDHPQTNVTLFGDTVADTAFRYSRQVWTPTLKDTLPKFNIKGLATDASTLTDLLTLVYKNLR